jgi:hypothetical protein
MREQLIDWSIAAAVEIARGNDSIVICDHAAAAMEEVLELAHVLNLADRLTSVEVAFVPHEFASVIARRAPPEELTRLAPAIARRMDPFWKYHFYMTCAERFSDASREAALKEALQAAREKKSVLDEIEALSFIDHSQARQHAQQWLSELRISSKLLGFFYVSDLANLLERRLVELPEVNSILEFIDAHVGARNFGWLGAGGLGPYRTRLPALDKLIRSSVEAALKEPPWSLTIRQLTQISAALTLQERADLTQVAAEAKSDIRAILLARILRGTPPADGELRQRLIALAKSAIHKVDSLELRMRSIRELNNAAKDALEPWCARAAFDTAARSPEALDAFYPSEMLRYSEILGPNIVQAYLPTFLQIAQGVRDGSSIWSIRISLAGATELRRLSSQAIEAARRELPDVDAAIAILERTMGAAPQPMRSGIYEQACQWMREDEETVDKGSQIYLEKILRRTAFAARVLRPEEIQPSELWEVLDLYRDLDYSPSEAVVAWKFADRLIELGMIYRQWFERFQPAFLSFVQSASLAEFVIDYWVICGRIAPPPLRRRFLREGVQALISARPDGGSPARGWPSRERAIGLYALAGGASWPWRAFIREAARKLEPNLVLRDGFGKEHRASVLDANSLSTLSREWVSRSIAQFMRAGEPQRAKGYYEALGRARRLDAHRTTELAGQFVRLLDDVASFPRRDVLDLLNSTSASIEELIGSGAANAAVDDIAGLWP